MPHIWETLGFALCLAVVGGALLFLLGGRRVEEEHGGYGWIGTYVTYWRWAVIFTGILLLALSVYVLVDFALLVLGT